MDIPITQIGSIAAQTIVTDLQSHPKTKSVVAAVDDLQMGLPQAEKVAGIDVPGIGISTNPVNLQQIKEGGQLAGYATDLHFVSWTLMDQAAREITGQDFDYSALTSGPTPATNQVITKDNVPADLAAGYIAFPDYKEKFSALWAGK